MQFLDCKITLSFSNQKIKDRSETLINKGIYEVKLKFIASLIVNHVNTLDLNYIMQILLHTGTEQREQALPRYFQNYLMLL